MPGIRTDVEQLEIVPIKVSHWSWAKEIARECQHSTDVRHEQRRAWERKYLGRDKEGNFFQKHDAPVPPEFAELRPGIRWGARETLVVDIAWECFTNDEIATYFRKWVKCVRPQDVPKPDNKGHKPGDWRAHLTRLATMRLLSRYTPKEIIGTKRATPSVRCLPIHSTKQFAGRKWGDSTKWYDARREAGKLFHALFPFLPKDDKPLSWERQKPAE